MTRRKERAQTRQSQPATALLIDAGPLVALIDRADNYHRPASAILKQLPSIPLLTTWPCLAEASYLLGSVGGHPPQDILLGYVTDGLVQLHDLTAAECGRIRELMAKYADTPMDLADASLVAVAESRKLRRIFTRDDDFYVYSLGRRDNAGSGWVAVLIAPRTRRCLPSRPRGAGRWLTDPFQPDYAALSHLAQRRKR